jgi:hypothetical protein
MKIGKVAAYALGCASLVVGASWADELGENSFELPKEVISSATAFEDYMKNAAGIGHFSSDDSVADGVRAGVSYQPAQLEEGMIAYGAIVALQDDRFVGGVRDAAGRGEARQAYAERLVEDPFAVTRVEGAGGAARRIEAALGSRAAPLMDAAIEVKAAAYSVQHQAWSKVMVADAQGRLAEVKSLSARRSEPSESDNQQMMERLASAELHETSGGDTDAGYSAIEARALALAAESVLGHARGDDRERLAPLLTETSSAQCLRMAKLNLYQCMAVAGPQYEDIFCLGQHAMYDTGACVDHAAHGPAATVADAAPRASERVSYAPLAAHRSLRIVPN